MLRLLASIYAMTLPFEQLWFEWFGVDTVLKPYRLAGIALLLASAIAFLAMSSRRRRYDVVDVGMLFVFLMGFVMFVFWYLLKGEGNLSWAAGDGILMGFAIAVFFALRNRMRSFTVIDGVLRAFAFGTGASIAIYLAAFGSLMTGRFSAFCHNPNRFALAAAVSVFILLAEMALRWRQLRRWQRVIRAAMLFLCLLTLPFTGSRGALAAAGASLVVLVGSIYRSRSNHSALRSRLVFAIPFFLLGALVINVSIEKFGAESSGIQRYSLSVESAADNRLDIWESAWNLSRDHYFLGVGFAQYRHYHRRYVNQLQQIRSSGVGDHDLGAHSDYLDLLTTHGIFSLLAYLWVLVVLVRTLWRRLLTSERSTFALPAVLAMLTLVSIMGVTHITMIGPDYWFILATAAAAATVRKSLPGQKTAPTAVSLEPRT